MKRKVVAGVLISTMITSTTPAFAITTDDVPSYESQYTIGQSDFDNATSNENVTDNGNVENNTEATAPVDSTPSAEEETGAEDSDSTGAEDGEVNLPNDEDGAPVEDNTVVGSGNSEPTDEEIVAGTAGAVATMEETAGELGASISDVMFDGTNQILFKASVDGQAITKDDLFSAGSYEGVEPTGKYIVTVGYTNADGAACTANPFDSWIEDGYLQATVNNIAKLDYIKVEKVTDSTWGAISETLNGWIPNVDSDTTATYNTNAEDIAPYVEVVNVSTAEELQSAIDNAEAGDTIKFANDITTNKVIDVKKSITIDGNGKTLNTTATRGIWIDETGVTLNINNLTIDGKNTCQRAVQVNVLDSGVINKSNINMENCTIKGITYYAINLCSKTEVELTIKNSDITGWSALNIYSQGFKTVIENCKLTGINDKGYNADGWNNFGTVILEGDTTGQTEDASYGNTVTIKNSEIISTQTTGNKQYGILFNSKSHENNVILENTTISVPENSCAIQDNGDKNTVTQDGVRLVFTASDLQSAVNAGENVKLMSDITTDKAIQITKSVTIDGNGYNVKNNATDENNNRVFNIKDVDGLTVNFKNVNMIQAEAGYSRGISMYNAKNTTVNVEDCTINGANYGINIASYCDNAKVNVKNSEINGWAAIQSWSKGSIVNVENSTLVGTNNYSGESNDFATIVINEDTTDTQWNFVNSTIKAVANTERTQALISIRADNTTVTMDKDTKVVLEGDNATLMIPKAVSGTKVYQDGYRLAITNHDLKSAVENGENVKLMNDITTSEAITVEADAKVNLDLAGHELNRTSGFTLQNHGELNINDSVGGGSVATDGSVAIGNYEDGILNIEGISVMANATAIRNGNIATIKNATITSKENNAVDNNNQDKIAEITITNSNVIGDKGNAINNDGKVKVTNSSVTGCIRTSAEYHADAITTLTDVTHDGNIQMLRTIDGVVGKLVVNSGSYNDVEVLRYLADGAKITLTGENTLDYVATIEENQVVTIAKDAKLTIKRNPRDPEDENYEDTDKSNGAILNNGAIKNNGTIDGNGYIENGITGTVVGNEPQCNVYGVGSVVSGEITNANELARAIEMASAGDTLTLNNDITTDKAFEIDKSITIDGGDNKYSVTTTAGDRVFNIENVNNLTVNFKNMNINQKDVSYSYGIRMRTANNITLNVENCTIDGARYGINIASFCDNAKVNVKNSEINGWAAIQSWSAGSIVNVENSTLVGTNNYTGTSNDFATIVVNNNGTNIASDTQWNFVNSTIKAVANTETKQYAFSVRANNTTITMDENSKMVLEGANAEYVKVNEDVTGTRITNSKLMVVNTAGQLESAVKVGGSVKLGSNIVADVVVAEGVEVNLDLAGYKLTNKAGHTITNNGKLTITDSSAKHTGVVDNITHAKAAIYNANGATAILDGGTFTRSQENGTIASNGGNSYYTILNQGTMDIKKGTFENNGTFSSLLENGWFTASDNTTKANAELTIENGTFNGGKYTIKNDDYGKMIIKDGEFTSNYGCVLNWNELTIENGEFVGEKTCVLNGADENLAYESGKLTIDGGTFDGAIAEVDGNKKAPVVNSGSYNDFAVLDYLADGANVSITDVKKIIEAGETLTIKAGTTVNLDSTVTIIMNFAKGTEGEEGYKAAGKLVVDGTLNNNGASIVLPPVRVKADATGTATVDHNIIKQAISGDTSNVGAGALANLEIAQGGSIGFGVAVTREAVGQIKDSSLGGVSIGVGDSRVTLPTTGLSLGSDIKIGSQTEYPTAIANYSLKSLFFADFALYENKATAITSKAERIEELSGIANTVMIKTVTSSGIDGKVTVSETLPEEHNGYVVDIINDNGSLTHVESTYAHGALNFEIEPNATYVIAKSSVSPEQQTYSMSVSLDKTAYNVGDTVTATISAKAKEASAFASFGFTLADLASKGLELKNVTATNGELSYNINNGQVACSITDSVDGIDVSDTKDTAIATATFKVTSKASDSVEIALSDAEMTYPEQRKASTVSVSAADATIYDIQVTLSSGDGATFDGDDTDKTYYAKYGESDLYSDDMRTSVATMPEVTAKDGYRLANKDGEVLWNMPDGGFTEDVTLTANTIAQFSVSFAKFVEDGKYISDIPETANVDKDSMITLPTVKANTNYTFVGWFDGNTKVASADATEYKVTTNVTLTPKFEASTFDLVQSVSNAKISNVTNAGGNKVTFGKAVTFKVAADDGYAIKSVAYKIGDGTAETLTATNGVYTIDGENITGKLTIEVSAVEYATITFAEGEGTIVNDCDLYVVSGANGYYENISDIESGTTTTAPTVSKKDGYRLADKTDEYLWIVGESGYTQEGLASAIFSENTTVTSHAIKVWNITFEKGEHGTLVGDTTVVTDAGVSPVAPSVNAEAGYKFVGWDKTLSSATADATYIAQYEDAEYGVVIPADDDKYSITDMTGVTDSKATHGTDVTFKVTAVGQNRLKEVTYSITGGESGTLTADANGVYTIEGSKIIGGITIAVSTVGTHTVMFVSEDSTKGSVTGSSFTIDDGSKVSSEQIGGIRTSAELGYQFAYWYTTDENTKVNPTEVVINENTTFKAKFIDASYEVSAPEGVSLGAVSATHGTDFTFTPVKEGVIITGVSAKIGNNAITVTANADGSYTIAGAAIVGNITLEVTGSVEGSINFISENEYKGLYAGTKIAKFNVAKKDGQGAYVLSTGKQLFYSSEYTAYVAIVSDEDTEAILAQGLTYDSAKSTTDIVYGDMNGDGKFTATDAGLINSILHQSDTYDGVAIDRYHPTEAERLAADITGNGNVSTNDIIQALNKAVGKDVVSDKVNDAK